MTNQVAILDTTRCSGCGRCISACEFRLFSLETKAWKKRSVMLDVEQCSGCGVCAARCATGAISMGDKPSQPGEGITPDLRRLPSGHPAR
ncbi:ATP-binding protein [Rhodoferax sp.]|uniref:ATP-binding protein n=1 Tax=Rhodoferax sp. TaxID=50421 RepID=UPI00351D71A0